jgi:hypothetical protein
MQMHGIVTYAIDQDGRLSARFLALTNRILKPTPRAGFWDKLKGSLPW